MCLLGSFFSIIHLKSEVDTHGHKKKREDFSCTAVGFQKAAIIRDRPGQGKELYWGLQSRRGPKALAIPCCVFSTC